MHRLSTVEKEALCSRCGSPDHTKRFCPLTSDGAQRCAQHNRRHTPFVPSFESWVDFPVICVECRSDPPLPMELIQKGIAAARLGVWTSVLCALSLPSEPGRFVGIMKGDRRESHCGRPRFSDTIVHWACHRRGCLAWNQYYVPDETLPERQLYDNDARTWEWGNRRLGPLLAPHPRQFKERKRLEKDIGYAEQCPLLCELGVVLQGPWMARPTGRAALAAQNAR
jgi:hypothetical protein